MNFTELGLDASITDALKKEKIVTPTEVQEKVYEAIAQGKNILAQSKTGSGKTLAYLLPFIQKYKEVPEGNKVLVLVPTHELAMQVTRQVKSVSENAGLHLMAQPIVGNVNIARQIDYLKKKPQFIVGTPGRIFELIKKKKIAAHLMEAVILDEADKLLSDQQIEETKAVVKCCMRDVQKLFFSASISTEAESAAKSIATDLEVVRLDAGLKVADNLQHQYIVCDGREKIEVLRGLVSALKPQKAMVFINKVYDIEQATQKLKYHHYSADCIHGNSKKADRKKVIDNFHNGKLKVMIGTDLASRGLHFEDVDVVVHYTIPEDEKDYLHRAGRCARGKETGLSISIVTPAEIKRIRRFEKKLGIKMQEKILRKGVLADYVRKMK